MKSVLGIGNALVDVIVRLIDENLLSDFFLPKGSMQLVDNTTAGKIDYATTGFDIKLTSGGSSANTIHGLAKLGIQTGYIGKTGNDQHGSFFREDMKNAGIETHITPGSTDTGRAITLVTPDSERTFATYLGSSVELTSSDLDEVIFKRYSIVHAEGYLVQNHALVEDIFKLAKKCGLLVSLDLSSYNVVEANLEFLKEMTEKYVDIVFANEEEARSFTGENPEKAVKDISLMCDIAVVKTGKSGSIIRTKGNEYNIGIIKANSIDTTGAGDLYAAGFLYGVSKGLSFDKCGNIGALLSGKVIEVLGAKIPLTIWPEVIQLKDKIESIS